MRRNHPKNSKAKEERYDVQYMYMKEKPFLRKIIHHPMKTVYINMCAWPWATEDEVIRY